MNIQQYISSGIIESYVIGLAPPEEASQLERLLPFYPELQSAISDFGFQLELFAIQHEEPPPPGLFEKINGRVRDLPAVREPFRQGHSRTNSGSSEEYIPVQASNTHIWVHKSWRTWFIIFCIMSKVFLGLTIYYFVQYRHAEKDLRSLQQQVRAGKAQLSPESPDNDK